MKRLITLIMVGLMLFMVPLSCFAETFPFSTINGMKSIIIKSYSPTYHETTYMYCVTNDMSVLNVTFDNTAKNIYFSKPVFSNYWIWDEGSSIKYPYNDSATLSGVNHNISSLGFNPNNILTVMKSDFPIYDYVDPTQLSPINPGPEVYNYTINPGDYCRITKPVNTQGCSITVHVVPGNEPYYKVKNYTILGGVNVYEATSLQTALLSTTDHMDIQLKSTRANEPITIETAGTLEKLSTGGNPPPDGTVYDVTVLDDNPDTIVLTNLTGMDQKITYYRLEAGDSQYTTLKVEKKISGYWQVMGATPQITDIKSRTVSIAANTRYTIFNNYGSTKVSYPVMEGFNVATSTTGTGSIPPNGGGIVVPDDPTIITDPSQWGSIPGSSTTPERPDDILGILKWASDLVLSFLAVMGTALTSIFEFLGRFASLFGAISFLPPEFTIAFMTLLVVSLALRVVNR